MKKFNHKGFTVLELLVILGIIIILMALVLIALNAARARSTDERKVAALRPVVIELQDYFSVCREYPENISQSALDTGTPCVDLAQQIPPKTIRDIIPSAYDLKFNETGSNYHYQALQVASIPGECTNFHIWVTLSKPGGTLLQQKSNMDTSSYTQYNLGACNGIVQQSITTNDDTIVDIFK